MVIVRKAGYMMNNFSYKNNAGFTLLEVLVSLVILAIGLLGVAGLQVTALANNNSSAQRSQATALVSEYADILRSNRPQLELNFFGTSASDGVEIDTDGSSYSPTAGCKTVTGGCTSQQMAETDLSDWIIKVGQLLPDGKISSNRNGDVYTVTVTWLDDKKHDSIRSFRASFIP